MFGSEHSHSFPQDLTSHPQSSPPASGYATHCPVPALMIKISNPVPNQNPQPHKHHHALTFAIVTWLNITSIIPVDKHLPVPGPVPWFLRIMTSNPDDFGKIGTTGTTAGSVVPEFSRVTSGLKRRPSPTDTPLRSWVGVTGRFAPGPDQYGKYFLPVRDPAYKKPVTDQPEVRIRGSDRPFN